MFNRLSSEALARASASHPWRTVLAWLVVLVASAALVATLFADGVTSAFTFTNKPESQRGADLIEELRGVPSSTNEVVVVLSKSLTVDAPEFERFVGDLREDLAALEGEVIRSGTLLSYYDARIPALVSQDRRATILPFAMAGDFDDASDNIGKVIAVVDTRGGQSEFEVLITGQAAAGQDFEKIAEEGLATGEAFGIPVALIILVLVCGAVVAAAVPIVLAIGAILVALGAAALVGQVFSLSFFVQNVVFMIGLAVGIDYSLFIVSRYREERAGGRDKLEAIAHTGNTATRAVFFSGVTVVLALIGMLMVPFNVFIGLGIGAILVVAASVLAAMTLLPAALSLLGDRINWLTIPFIGRFQVKHDESRAGGFWDRVSNGVMRVPVLSLAVGGGFLIAAAVPVSDLSTGFAGISTMPDDARSKRGFDIIDREFTAGTVTPAQIAIDGPVNSQAVQDAIARLTTLMAQDPQGSFDTPQPIEVSADGSSALLTVPVAGDAAEDDAKQAILRLRRTYVPAAFASTPGVSVYVTGETAFNIDFFTASNQATRYVFPFVLGMSLLLLMVVFRSIVVPIKAIILNMLSVGATYGILVLVFIKGWGADQLGLTQFPVIEAWIPLFLFTILFGLSMDYHVFLLSRIRERYDQTHQNAESVAFGIRTTGRLITGAALIMVAVFWAFAAGDLVGLQQMGVGLGVAVLLDATVVRMVLVPASMKLLGKWNWYFPSWLNWLPDIRVEARPGARATTSPTG
jgi:RND superfamily putative drug exporter